MATYIVGGILLVVVARIVYHQWKSRKKGGCSACGGGCDHCSGGCH